MRYTVSFEGRVLDVVETDSVEAALASVLARCKVLPTHAERYEATDPGSFHHAGKHRADGPRGCPECAKKRV